MANSLRQLTCSCGYAWELATGEDADSVRCPQCGEFVANAATPSTPKGLWALMQRTSEGPIEQPPDQSPTEPTNPPRPRSLWAIMGESAAPTSEIPSPALPKLLATDEAQPTAAPSSFAEVPQAQLGSVSLRPLTSWRQVSPTQPTSNRDSSPEPATRRDAEEIRRTGLQTRQAGEALSPLDGPGDASYADSQPRKVAAVPNPKTKPLADDDLEGDSSVDDEDGWELDDPDGEARVAQLVAEEPTLPPATPRDLHSRRAFIAAVIALIVIPLHLAPWWWIKWPAGLVGLAAVLLGHQAWIHLQPASGSWTRRCIAAAAMTFGALCMLAGPLGLNSFGHRVRNVQSAARRDPTRNLTTLGQGLAAYHDEHGHFPAGGTFETTSDGNEVALHGWMTALLPYIGHADLARQIDRSRPYDHLLNLPIMSRPVDTFLSPGVPHEPTLSGLATTHFAGVGGQREDDSGMFHLGIFDRNSGVRRVDVVDGLSNTFVAGEINQNYPPWGDPENWRQIDAPLNEHPYGFGNATRTGAHFLMADGSVRFIPNATSMDVLRKLATRDGREPDERPNSEPVP